MREKKNVLFTIAFLELELRFKLAEEGAVLLYTFAQLRFQRGRIICLIQSFGWSGNSWNYNSAYLRRCTSKMASSSCAHVWYQSCASLRTSLAAWAMVWGGTWREAARVEWARCGVSG